MTLTMQPHRETVGLEPGLLYIDGEWGGATDGATWTHRHPATGEDIGELAVASASDVDAAVAAARRRFDSGEWSNTRAQERIAVLRRCGALLREHAEQLRGLQALDNSVPVGFGAGVYAVSVEVAADVFDHHAGWVDKLGGETLTPYQGGDHLAMTFREPIGVVAAILPWNAPFLLFAQKVAPALATGCTVVLKPSEYCTFTVLRMVELLEEAGVPAGVLNVVTGPGDPTGERLITHPDVDKVSFTGSRGVGSRIVEASAATMKRVSLELGGKSPAIVFDDAADVGLAAATTIGAVTLGLSGQACVANTRALVHRSVYDEFIAAAEGMAGMVSYGDPFDPAVMSAPLINGKQLDRVLGYIERGKADGARLVTGGERLDGDYANGNFVAPTIFADVDNASTLAQEEVFGPVLAVIPFDDEDEAVAMANDTEYGLGASVFSANAQRTFRMARKVRAGTVCVNGFQLEPHLPFGGFKQSGLGREGGKSSIESFTELKTVLMPLGDEMM
ncbi:aldehyde dehydrogenase (NAD+) [Prauserella aidingensis]|uniref:aldehyde dehydrogenase family protein n=1 Tax=Prauserella aidingensis TaxID=387890 RepID=UPI0020A352BC|nr:aldehyde dehydrogenase family protein [Prauserella aidingensis]MCP2253383.1 aldehyde dehydrogenase (NAD+) [Prauserella aidingensis]